MKDIIHGLQNKEELMFKKKKLVRFHYWTAQKLVGH